VQGERRAKRGAGPVSGALAGIVGADEDEAEYQRKRVREDMVQDGLQVGYGKQAP